MRELAVGAVSAEILLDWYDAHARTMPWRVPPAARKAGERANPYRVWLSEIMLQQTTVAAVKSYFLAFTERWPTVEALAAARDEEVMAAWAGLGYYARARNLLACARVVAGKLEGKFPDTEDGLRALPGIGPYTAAAVSAIAFDRPATVVDGNVERVMSRVFDEHTPLPAAKPILTDHAQRLTPTVRPGDYAQAVMDLGATICTPKSPACGICPWRDPCEARQAGTAPELPKKTPKKPKPTRLGFAYLAISPRRDVLLETRPPKGLLGGMLAFPCSDWSDNPTPAPPFQANWHDTGLEALHTFTHFHLRLKIMTARTEAQPTRGMWVPRSEFRPSSLPTLMRKVWDLGHETAAVAE